MKLSDDFDNEHIKSGISLGTMIVGVLFFVGIVVVSDYRISCFRHTCNYNNENNN